MEATNETSAASGKGDLELKDLIPLSPCLRIRSWFQSESENPKLETIYFRILQIYQGVHLELWKAERRTSEIL